jgi:hypothetical protein
MLDILGKMENIADAVMACVIATSDDEIAGKNQSLGFERMRMNIERAVWIAGDGHHFVEPFRVEKGDEFVALHGGID